MTNPLLNGIGGLKCNAINCSKFVKIAFILGASAFPMKFAANYSEAVKLSQSIYPVGSPIRLHRVVEILITAKYIRLAPQINLTVR